MQQLQRRYGPDKVAILLISVDLSYGDDRATATRELKRTMATHKVQWPCVLEPAGWKGVAERFNLDGYSLSLIAPGGTVHDVDIRAEELDRQLRALSKEHRL